jgi:hypothetical protein
LFQHGARVAAELDDVGPDLIFDVAADGLRWASLPFRAIEAAILLPAVAVSSRIATQNANTMRFIELGKPPTPFQTLLNQAAQRVILLGANTARQQQMIYPRSLVGDTAAPVISARSAAPAAGGIRVTWTTDEFADSTIIFGTQPGVYPQTRADPLYVRSHAILLTGLPPGTYYCRMQSRDQSGNAAQSAEGSFTVVAGPIPRAYLSLIIR